MSVTERVSTRAPFEPYVRFAVAQPVGDQYPDGCSGPVSGHAHPHVQRAARLASQSFSNLDGADGEIELDQPRRNLEFRRTSRGDQLNHWLGLFPPLP